ncbi:MAG: hypothetical protein II882_10335 [Lachnospiraceae bacterium]|nr:hypothetical protein [Lachnospiraceae bacterium]
MKEPINKKDWREAAGNVQKEWLKETDRFAALSEAPLPEGMEARLRAAWQADDAAGKPRLRRSFPRAAAVVITLLLLFGSLLAVDQKVQAQVQDWLQRSNQDHATSAYHTLLRFIGGTGYDRSLYRNAKGEAYRKYYGGAYLGMDDRLVICLTDTSAEITDAFQEALGDYSFTVRKVTYSYDELDEMMKYVSSRIQEEHIGGISSFGVNERDNCIEVRFSEEDRSEELFSLLGRDERDMFRFEEYTGFVVFDDETNDRIWLEILLKNGIIDGCRLTAHGDFEAARTALPEASEDRISEDIEETIRNKVAYNPIIIPLEKQVMEKGDLGKIAYKVYDEFEVYSNMSAEYPETVCCGETVPFNPHIGDILEGLKVGETITFTYDTAPDRHDNRKMTCDVTLLYIYRTEPAELSDDFVRANTGYGSVEEWRAALRRQLLRNGQPEGWERILNKLLPACEFSIDEEKLSAFAEKRKQSEAWFRKLIEEYLLVEAIAEEYGLSVTEADRNAYFEQNYYMSRDSQSAVTEERVLRQKVMDYMTFVP